MTTYTQLTLADGSIRVDQVLRDDGARVATGLLPGPGGVVAVPDFGDPDGLAYQAWLEAGNLPGTSVPSPADLLAYANAKQWALATGGYTLTLSGHTRTFATSEISMTLMNGKFLRLTQPNAPATMAWQFATGFESIASTDFAKAAVAVSDFVQATFDALQAVFAGVASGTITTTAQVDAAAWPSAVAPAA